MNINNMLPTDYASIISPDLNITIKQVAAVINLLDEKATIPFIARYRKEATGGLDEVQISDIQARYMRLLDLCKRKETIFARFEELNINDDALYKRVADCWDATTLEDIYLPYKPHRKTRADIAIERGLQPLAEDILRQHHMRLPDNEEDLQGARDIIAQRIAEDERSRNAIRREFAYTAVLTTKKTDKKNKTPDELQRAQNYADYFDMRIPLKHIRSHQLLAIRRAEDEGFIRVDISCDQDKALDKLYHIWVKSNNNASDQVAMAVDDSYKRLIKPSIETEFAASSKEKADTEAIRVFSDNLRQLLLGSPLGQKRVLAIDPGFRTGCKTVVLNEQGDLLTHTVVYHHNMQSAETLDKLIRDYHIEAVAIGNGTASRETEQMVRSIVGCLTDNKPQIFVVSEAGASVYSASKTAREEFPDEDVTVRGAVSIGRRLIDPLAELVKIDPKSIGVGQYQHDVDQTRLRDSLQQTVESVVNYVGVDVNTASKHLLTYISGLGPTIAQNIVDYRSKNGAFTNRKALLKVPKMGAKTFEQAAGFLRLKGDNPLDNSAVHPESYPVVEQMAKDLNCSVADLMNNEELRRCIDLKKYVSDKVGMPTLTDIMHELAKPGRDPRTQIEEFRFDDTVHDITDLREGMELPAIVTNVSAFGAFVDLGVHKDGLIHVSELGKYVGKRINDPQQVVKLHQHIRVRVLKVDTERNRIQLALV